MLTELTKNGSTPGTIVIFNDLQVNTQFQFRVRASTSTGPGPFSRHVIGRVFQQSIESKGKSVGRTVRFEKHYKQNENISKFQT